MAVDDTTGMHVSRAWGRDPFAPDCGCSFAVCGLVVARSDCTQHGPAFSMSICQGHAAEDCPGRSRTDGAP